MKDKLLNTARRQIIVPLQSDRPCQELHVDETVFLSQSVVYLCRAILVRHQTRFVVRGDSPEPDWPRQYKAESLDISLHLSHSSAGNYILLGILTSTDAATSIDTFEGVDAELHFSPGPFASEGDKQAEKPLLRTQVDDLGQIFFSNVPGGEYVMILHLPGLDVIIEELPLK